MLNDSQAYVSVQAASRWYGSGDGQVVALNEADVTLDTGKFTVILGPSGSGKSTLLNLLGGMDSPSSGSVRVGNHQLDALNDRELTQYRRTEVGFVFQFYNLIPNLTAKENVAIAAALTMPQNEGDRSAEQLLRDVGLGHRLNNFPKNLSGGEMQRVAIARALSKRPKLLLCDEPSGALDSKTGQRILAQLQRTAHQSDTAVVAVTHDASLAEAADRLIHLKDGAVVEMSDQQAPRILDQEVPTQ